MKSIIQLSLAVFAAYLTSSIRADEGEALLRTPFSSPLRGEWMAVKRSANQTLWHSIEIRTNALTQRVHYRTNAYVELGAGINVANGTNGFQPANPGFNITADGALADGTAHQVFAPGDIWSGAGIRITQPDGRVLVLQPLGIDYYDPSDGRSVLVDAVTNAVGWLTASNEIVFSNCLTRIKASIRLRNMPWGLEQDLIFHERPEDPTVYGLSSDSRLEMMTEQVLGESPSERPRFLRRETEPQNLLTMAEPHFIDSELSFSSMKMPLGRAFGLNRRTNELAMLKSPVGKIFETNQQRRVLIEAVEHRRVLPLLRELPSATNVVGITNAAVGDSQRYRHYASLKRRLPMLVAESSQTKSSRTARIKTAIPSGTMLAGKAAEPPSAVVLDYQLVNVNGVTGYTFHGGTNYLISSTIALNGTTTIQGGAVIKFLDGTGLFITSGGSLVCDTTPTLPAIFTSIDDNTIGETFAGSSGTPYQLGTAALNFDGGNYQVSNLRFRHIGNPIQGENGSTITARNVQFENAYSCFQCYGGTFTLNVYNALAKSCDYFYIGDITVFRGEHLTVHNGIVLGSAFLPNSSSAVVRNSLLVDMQYPPNYAGSYTPDSTEMLSSAGLFQTVEGGAYYLANNSPHRDIGSSQIDATLKKALSEMTTYPPATILTGLIQSDSTLTAATTRDTGIPDRGYHYPAIDCIVRDATLQNANVAVPAGRVIGIAHAGAWAGLTLAPGRLIGLGGVTNPVRLVRMNQVHEGVTVRGATMIASGVSGAFKPELILRHAEVSSLAGEENLLYMENDFTRMELTHSSLLNASVYVSLYGGTYQSVGFTNCLFLQTPCVIGGLSQTYFSAYNNLFKGRSFSLTGVQASWIIRDNVFDNVSLGGSGGPTIADHNAYVGMPSKLSVDTGVGSPLLGIIAYTEGPLGKYYVSSEVLSNPGGSRTSAEAGFYHYTTRPGQEKDSGTVDLGLHYVATSLYPSAPGPQAVYFGTDTSTRGDWKAKYGADGFNVILDAQTYPGYAVVVPSGKSDYAFAVDGSGNRCLQRPYAPGRVANCWYGGTWTINMEFSDDKYHRVAFYCADMNTTDTRAQTIEVRNTASNTLLNSQGLASFSSGKYMVWDVRGNVTFKVNQTGLYNALISGIFFSTPHQFFKDEDGDGLPDYLEDLNGNGQVEGNETSWVNWDTDLDQLPDSWELQYLLSPLSAVGANGAQGDPDQDGLTNLQEFQLLLDPSLNQSAQPTLRRNYDYDRINRLDNVTGVEQVDFTLDKEGNITNVNP